jgi:sugar lactone lactonase YvrE
MIAAVVGAALVAAAPAGGMVEEPRERWDTRVFAHVPTPGFPAKAYAAPNGRVYEGTYDNPAGDHVASRVFEYRGDGTLLRSWAVEGQDLASPHGVQVATMDSRGRLVLLEKSLGQALLLNRRTGRQRVYATFPDLPPCGSAPAGADCSPTQGDEHSMPNYGVWGPGGRLYVTDYLQGVIWVVPPGGGTAEMWLADGALAGESLGTTGLFRLARRTLLVAQQSNLAGSGNPVTGKIYSVPIEAGGTAGPITKLWESGPLDLPDGLAVGASGTIYVALLGTNQLAAISPTGDELERFPSAPLGGANGSPIPFDTPSNVAFLGRRVIVANQSFLAGDLDHQALLDVWIGEPGLEERIPARAGVR